MLQKFLILSLSFLLFNGHLFSQPESQDIDNQSINTTARYFNLGCEEWGHEIDRNKCLKEILPDLILQNLNYPVKALDKGIEGIVKIQFVVNIDSTLSDFVISNDIGEGCGLTAIAAIRKLGNWIPAKEKDNAIASKVEMDIDFDIEAYKKFLILNLPKESDLFDFVRYDYKECSQIKDTCEYLTCYFEAESNFIHENIEYPEEARKNRIEGFVVVEFIVNIDGTTSLLNIRRDIGGGCGEEVLRLVSTIMGKWIPREVAGKKVTSVHQFTVNFSRKKMKERRKLMKKSQASLPCE